MWMKNISVTEATHEKYIECKIKSHGEESDQNMIAILLNVTQEMMALQNKLMWYF